MHILNLPKRNKIFFAFKFTPLNVIELKIFAKIFKFKEAFKTFKIEEIVI